MLKNLVIEGPDLDRAERVIIVIHGMSTTVETLRAGYPVSDERLTKIYWRLPVLREGADQVRARRDSDFFENLFTAVVDESRAELRTLIQTLQRPVGLFGFSIGGLIALWGALDNPEVEAVVTMGAVASLDYLKHYYPDYAWDSDPIKARLRRYDLAPRVEQFAATPVLLCHGDEDDVAHWDWMAPFAEKLTEASPASTVRHYPTLHHRLAGESAEENAELTDLRSTADQWFLKNMVPMTPAR